MKKNKIFVGLAVLVAIGVVIFFVIWKPANDEVSVSSGKLPVSENSKTTITVLPTTTPVPMPTTPNIIFVGPREGIPSDAPKDYGLWSFAMPVPNVLSRSGQPLLSGFKWMKENGWKSVVDLRVDGERGEVGDDRKIKGFNELGLNYLPLPIADGSPPTDAQAKEFLAFVTKPANQPAHVHCRGGIGRAGTMVILYRYSAQGWPMDKAIEESREFQGGISEEQVKWLNKWASANAPGSFAL